MEISNKYIFFDTNMWLKILSKKSEINRDLLENLQKKNQFGMYNISLIEILMRFYRKKNFKKIKEVLKYINVNINNEKLVIGNINSPNFNINESKIMELMNKNDDDILSAAIEKFKKNRFEFKSSIIALWIVILLEIYSPAFTDDKSKVDDIVRCFESKSSKIKDIFVKYFYETEESELKSKNLRDITNKVFKEIFNEVAKETNIIHNQNYILMQNEISKLAPNQSISYVFKGVYDSELMSVYRRRIDAGLDKYFHSEIFKDIFYKRLKAFMQGECLQKNDVEDMLMLSVLEKDNNIILVTDDNKMISYIKNNKYNIGNKIHDSLINKI